MQNKKNVAERQSAGVIVYNMSVREPKVLLLHYVAGHWDFPKGHVEAGETLEQTALRELHEEAGVQAVIECNFTYTFYYSVRYPGLPEQLKEVTLFMGVLTPPAQNVTLSHEHTEYAWLTHSEALQRLTYDNAKKALVSAKQWASAK